MIVDVALIQRPNVDFAKFLTVTREALGYSPAKAADASRVKLSDTERFISCLDALRNPESVPGLREDLLSHVQFGVLFAVDERDLVEVLEVAQMQFVTTETRIRGVSMGVISGTLAQWRDAVIRGTQKTGAVQAMYCRVLAAFESDGIKLWAHCKRMPSPDPRLFSLELK